MSYKDQRGFTDSFDNQKDFNEKYLDKDPGPFLATVKFTEDPEKMGRLGVNIPALTGTTDPTPNQITWCQYLSPFYGVKSLKSVSKTDPYSYKASQTSYGMWAVPPDIDTTVLVIFAKGDHSKATAFWMGCVQEPLTNQQIPGHGATAETSLPGTDGDFTQDKKDIYGTDTLPAGEKNRVTADVPDQIENQKFPINERLADQLMKQGLVQDPIRGTTTSSARRESPSAVFGISTPGRISPDSAEPRIGLEGTPVKTDRESGHSFVMDDGDVVGNNQLTRLRTASGHQLLMHDTQGVVYIANGSGNAYIEMQANGRIDVYSGVGGINLRTEGDFNLHSDLNINMHANGQIRMSSAKEMIQSADAILTVGERGVLQSSPAGGIQNYALNSISSYTPGGQYHGALGQFHVQGGRIDLNLPMQGVGDDGEQGIAKWGPHWLNAEKVGLNLREEGDVELTDKGRKPLQEFTRKTKTTVHRLVTHEPMFRASVIDSDGVVPVDADDKKQWSRNANTPGTTEFVNQQNRLSVNSAIRDAQYQADALQYVKQKIGNSTSTTKARDLLTEFGIKYNEIYGISEKINLPFDIKDSISEKIKGIEFNSDAKKLYDTISSQVVEKFSGKSTELFKDNVFVNQAGELFALAKDANTTISGITGTIDIANDALNSLSGLKGNLSSGNVVGTIANLNSITQNYSSVVGGQVVGISQITKLAKKSGLYNPSAAQLGGQTFLQNVGQNIKTNLGNLGGAVKNFFSGFKF